MNEVLLGIEYIPFKPKWITQSIIAKDYYDKLIIKTPFSTIVLTKSQKEKLRKLLNMRN